MPRYSMTTATGRPASERHAPAGAWELGVVHVSDGVGGEEAVSLQEGQERGPITRGVDLQSAGRGQT